MLKAIYHTWEIIPKTKRLLMNFFTRIFSIFLFVLVFPFVLNGKEYRVEVQPAAIEKAILLPNEGVLKQKENGYVYLDVSNTFIESVVPLLNLSGELRALPTSTRSLGAHITVFDETEHVTPDALNSCFSFHIKEIRSFTIHTRKGLKKLWVIAVISPELENLRQQHGCSPKLKGNDFHITLGKQMPKGPENWEAIDSLSSLNFSEEPTQGLSETGDFIKIEHPALLATAAKVDAIGQLHLKANGFVYLNVDNEFIDATWQQLPIQGRFTPISTKSKSMSAHISTIYEDEMIGHEIWNLQEAGEWFTFEVKELRYVDRKTTQGKNRLWLLAADVPGLERLRTHYGLKPKLQGHDFHITLGTEYIEMGYTSKLRN